VFVLIKSSIKMWMITEHWWNGSDRVKQEVLEKKTCLSATRSTTNVIWTGLGSNLGLRGERSTNRLSLKTGFNVNYI